MQADSELPHLVRLLDDDDPAVRRLLEKHFSQFDGDLSRELTRLGIALDPPSRERLSHLLAPGRRRQIRHDWQVPVHGLDEGGGDWDGFEMLLRLLSEWLHDGTTQRPALPDALDALSDEAVLHDAHRDEQSLCAFLFGSGKFKANESGFYLPENADLVWVSEHRTGNPIGLALLAMLVAQRLNLNIVGCNFPAHFLAWTSIDGREHLVDCYHGGRLIALDELRSNSTVLTPEAQKAISRPCSQRDILRRILGNLHLAFNRQKRPEDADLVNDLIASIES